MARKLLGPTTRKDVIAEVKLPQASEVRIVARSIANSALKNIPALGGLLEAIEAIDQSVREEKLRLLLTSFHDRLKDTETAEAKLKALTSTREGSIFARKIIQIVERGDLNEEWIALLANALHNLSNSNLKTHFEEIGYALAQVDRLTPQQLILLSKYPDWKNVKLNGTSTASRHTTSGDWDNQAVRYLMRDQLPLETPVQERMAHTFRDLLNSGLIVLRDERITTEIIGEEIRQLIA